MKVVHSNFGQALFRKVQALGLQPAYTSDNGTIQTAQDIRGIMFPTSSAPRAHLQETANRSKYSCLGTVCGLHRQKIYHGTSTESASILTMTRRASITG
ncbi:hypothetical protein LSH36_567g01052 [Paralvinella palmiformis]|uniref:Uncharacterized protein n=1 Tax=Paralvinella palmiformis TaxID=53620 RepID=A0AAD9J639_9ANNE|nr:hypothetical protein LSH36_567g01052 [Paralvinella palmiformis]